MDVLGYRKAHQHDALKLTVVTTTNNRWVNIDAYTTSKRYRGAFAFIVLEEKMNWELRTTSGGDLSWNDSGGTKSHS